MSASPHLPPDFSDVGSVDHSCIFEGTLAWCSTSYLVAPGSPIQKLGMVTTERPTNKISLFSDQVAARDSTALADLACHSIRLQNFAWDLKKDLHQLGHHTLF